jgi:phospholipase/lecithinase/hemolysin
MVWVFINQNKTKTGFKYTTRACCGVGGKHNYDYGVQCGTSSHVHGQYLTALSCVNPDSYINWDGVHLTDRANRLLARHILTGAYFHPFFPLSQLCPSSLNTV